MGLFKKPVVVEPGRLGRFRIITGPADAISVLQSGRLDQDDVKIQKAIKVCRMALKGERQPHLARTSFVAAARQAKILISSEELRRYTIGKIDPLETDS